MPLVTTVLGGLDATSIDLFLPAETLIARPPRPLGNANLPATWAAFARAKVTPEMLGRLMLGAENDDDRTIEPHDAAGMLDALRNAHDGTVVVAALAGRGASWTPAELAQLAHTSGIAIVCGTNGLHGFDPDQNPPTPERIEARIRADLARAEHPAGAVGFIELPGADAASVRAVTAAASAARGAGVALVFAATDDLAALERGLMATDAAGLARERVVVTGLAELIAVRLENGAPGAGVDEVKLAAVAALGTAMCFDELGKIPNVTTVVSDHDTAVAIAVTLGALSGGVAGPGEGASAGTRVLVGCGVRRKHRLTAFGGNGLEFVPEQFLPYLGMVGAGPELLAAVAGGNAAAVFARSESARDARLARTSGGNRS